MEYRPPKKPSASLLLVAVLSSAAASLLAFATLGVGISYLLLAAAFLFFALSFFIISRFVVFDCLYRLDDDYSNPSLSCYVFRKKAYYLEEKIAFSGNEELLLLNKRGKKAIRKLSCRKDITSNLIPRRRYALVYDEENTRTYLVLELDDKTAARIAASLGRTKKLYADK